jgi:2-oxoglutarate dehydrogenase E2 component (dihydrolipoamide succinyltransferase)
MAQYELLLPKMGESVAEATVIKWLKEPGDLISLDDTLLEIATDKVDSEVPSPVAGKLISQLYKEDDVVQVGAVIALIEIEGDAAQPAEQKAEQPVATPAPIEQPKMTTEPSASVENVVSEEDKARQDETVTPKDSLELPGIAQLSENNTTGIEGERISSSDRFYSPLVKSIASQEQISTQELDSLTGSGADGRLTKDDLLNYIQSGRNNTVAKPAGQIQAMGSGQNGATASGYANVANNTTPSTHGTAAASTNVSTSAATSVSGADEIIEMDRMGKLISDHMVMSKQTSAHVTSFVEADVTNMVMWREKVKNTFQKRENEKITFTPIFIEAVAKALKDFPMVNVSVNGTQIIKKKSINIGMAAALPNGNLIVPVIKNADQLNLVGLTRAVNDLANRARGSKLKPDETQNGTFTLTNVGSFGNVMGTPIINQPQVAILAVGTIKKKPAVLETEFGDVIAIRHMMFLSLSYDHRVVNGALGGTFVRRVADYLENWDINREI